jgi:hypothetical protein
MKIALRALTAALTLTAAAASADVLVLRDGARIEGRLVAADRETLQFEEGDSLHMIPVGKVSSLEFGAEQDRRAATRTAPPPPPPTAPTVSKPTLPARPEASVRRTPSARPRPSASSAAATKPRVATPSTTAKATAPAPRETAPAAAAKTPAAARRVQVPAGIRLRVKIADTLDPRRNAKGDRFSAILEVPLVTGGAAVVPAHAKVYGVITQSETGGPVQNRLLLELTEMTVQGRLITIVTGTHKVLEPPSGGAPPAKPAAGGARPDRVQSGTILEFRLLTPVELVLR